MNHYQLIVVGGGLAGVSAAVSAAREGLRVLLVEKSGCLGGALSNNLVYPFTKYWTRDPEDDHQQYLSAGLFAEMRQREAALLEQYKEAASKTEYHFKPEYFKLLLDDMVTEAGVDMLFHAQLFDVKTAGNQVQEISVATVSGAVKYTADRFIDATGNGDLFALAGCDYQSGRERDGLCQPMTTCFRMSNVDLNQFQEDISRLQKLYKQQQADGILTNPRENLLYFDGIGENILHFNTTRVIKEDPSDPKQISRAEMTARRQVHETVKFLKENSTAFDHSTLISMANEIGVRESRKLKGMYILTQEDLKNMTDFEDSIALGNYDIDIHSPDGSGTSHYYFKKGEFYKIPYRCLVPKEYTNLLVAGRCISVTHEAQASIRIMAICACLGEAAGMAAAESYYSGVSVQNVDIKAVQEKLIANGALL